MALDPKKHEMPSQAPEVRAHNFNEVALGYTAELAVAEANRCLNCKNKPCIAGCPVNIDIPAFLQLAKTGDFEGAYQVINKTSSLPAVCGRVCPQETLTVRTKVLHDENNELITADAYEGKTISVKGLAGRHDGEWQIVVFSADNITISD